MTAPLSGTVGALSTHPGQALQAGQTVLSLVPSDGAASATLQAELYAASRTAGFIQPGEQVWLRLAAFPYQKFGMAQGEVRSVSRTPVNPQDLPAGQASSLLSAAQANEPLYRISVVLGQQHIAAYGQPQPLKAGMTLDADVVQDQRAIWEWLLEPLMAANAKLRISNGQDSQ